MLPPASLQQQHRSPLPRQRHGSVPINLFSPPPTIRIQAPTPPSLVDGQPQRRRRSTTAVTGWLKDVADLATPPSNGPSPISSPTKSFRSAVASAKDGLPLSLGNNSAEWAFPLSGPAATEARTRHQSELFKQQLRVADLQRRTARLAHERGAEPSSYMHKSTAKKGFWNGVKHRVASSLSLSAMTADSAPATNPVERATADASRQVDTLGSRQAMYQEAAAQPSFVSIRTNVSRVDANASKHRILRPARDPATVVPLEPSSREDPREIWPKSPRSQSKTCNKRWASLPPPHVPPPPPSKPSKTAPVAPNDLPHSKRNSSGFSLSSILRGDSRRVKVDYPVKSKLPVAEAAPRPQTPVVVTAPGPIKRSSTRFAGHRQSLYDEYRKPADVQARMTRSASGPLLSSSCHHCGCPTTQEGLPVAPPSVATADKYMATLFAAIERRLSETVQSDSSGETIIESKRLSLTLDGSTAPVILNFFPPASTGSINLDPVAQSHYTPDAINMDRSVYYVREKRALAKIEKEQRRKAYRSDHPYSPFNRPA